MALSADVKSKIISDFQKTKNDTGSVDVQVAILTNDIASLTEHLKANIHDYHSKRGLIKKVSRRSSLLTYLKSNDLSRYRTLIKRLGLRDKAK